MTKMSVKKIAQSEAFRNREIPPRMHNEVVHWLHSFCTSKDNCLILHTYEGQEIRIPVDPSTFTNPETGKPYQNVHALTSDITAALYGSIQVLISRAWAQAHHEDSPVSGWRPDPQTGESHYGYDGLDWTDD